MKLCSITIAIAIAMAGFGGAAAAGEAHAIMQPTEAIDLLSQATGLSIHEVEIALGPSMNYEHPTRYPTVIRRFQRAVGRTMYEQIIGDGELTAQQVQVLTDMAHARQAKLARGH